jgi:signal transduction histidine kinase
MSSAAPTVRPSFTRRALRELLYCLCSLPTGFGLIWILAGMIGYLGLMAILARAASGSALDGSEPVARAGALFFAASLVGLLVAVIQAPRLARRLGTVQRRLAARLLGEAVPPPPPVRVSRGRWNGLRWLTAGLRDGPGWRAMGYVVVKLPVAVLQGYAVFCALVGVVNVSFPFWWRLFRNHPPGVSLDPVPVLTPLGMFQVETFAGTFAVFAGGAAMILVAPWLARVATAADRALMRGLLGPGRLAQRVRDLEENRAHAVDDAAAHLRRIERDLHDGAQQRLVSLAMNLGMARERFTSAPEPVRQAIADAHDEATAALSEMREFIRGLHPAVLNDRGLNAALSGLAARAPLPVRLRVDLPRPASPSVEAVAYFIVSEALTNVAKHAQATEAEVTVRRQGDVLRIAVTDDGSGGAVPAEGDGPGAGTGLRGLAQRAAAVDGTLTIDSPPGGPTVIVAELPCES